MSIGLLENWSLRYHISRKDMPLWRIRELSRAIARYIMRGVTAWVDGSWRKSSSSNSWIARSATGFLFTFFGRPSSIERRRRSRSSLLTRERKPGALSVRITVRWPSSRRKSIHNRTRALSKQSFCSLSTKHATVYDVIDSRTTSISCFSRLITSPAYMRPTPSGWSDVVCSTTGWGGFRSEAH